TARRGRAAGRSNRAAAQGCARRVGWSTGAGRRDQRPDRMGGVRRPAATAPESWAVVVRPNRARRGRAGDLLARCAVPEPEAPPTARTARTGARVSLV